jgi:hypothetical protein
VRENLAIEADTKGLLTMVDHPLQGETEKVVEEEVFLFLELASCVYARDQEWDPVDIWDRSD